MHSFRKLLGLIVLYAIIIVGIFVIQFRSDSVIRKTIQGIRVTLAQTETNNGQTGLKNNFQIAYKGIVFVADENSPVTYLKDGVTRAAKLSSFEERGESAFALVFEEGIKLAFSLNEDAENPVFYINAELPEGIDSVNVGFAPNSGYNISERKAKSVKFAGKKTNEENEYALNGPAFNESVLTLQNGFSSAHYALFVENAEFSIDNIENFALASQDAYNATLKAVSDSLVSQFISAAESDASFASSLTEQTVISFLAEMTYIGRYNEGINTVPTQFINGNRRTYLSSPFLGGMAATMPTLTMQVQTFNNLIARAVQERTLDIYTVQNIAPYMYSHGNRGNVSALVNITPSLTANLTVDTAAGIIRAYTYFKQEGSSLANPLEQILEVCAQKIMESVVFEGEKVTVKDNDQPLSTYNACIAGDALVAYGQQFGESKIEHLGYAVVNSYAGNMDVLDLRSLGEIYPVLVHANRYYPHFELLRTMESNNIWAYTISPNMTYARDENLTISLNVEFPVGLSHYIFVNGIPPFRRIQIYNMDFRTDTSFETYNSSGYIYRTDPQTLLLKSRHRDKNEIIRLYYRAAVTTPAPQPAAATPAPAPAE